MHGLLFHEKNKAKFIKIPDFFSENINKYPNFFAIFEKQLVHIIVFHLICDKYSSNYLLFCSNLTNEIINYGIN